MFLRPVETTEFLDREIDTLQLASIVHFQLIARAHFVCVQHEGPFARGVVWKVFHRSVEEVLRSRTFVEAWCSSAAGFTYDNDSLEPSSFSISIIYSKRSYGVSAFTAASLRRFTVDLDVCSLQHLSQCVLAKEGFAPKFGQSKDM